LNKLEYVYVYATAYICVRVYSLIHEKYPVYLSSNFTVTTELQ